MYKKAQRILSVALFLIGWSDPGSGQSLQQFYTQNRGTWNSTVFIGADDGDPEALLSRPGSMGIDSKGSMYILDSQECCIKKFDSKGGFIKSFSRKGKGPGELEMAVRMVITGPDQIVVYDLGNRRFTVFDSEGQYVSSTAITDFVWNFCISPKGAYYIELHEWDWNGKKGGTLYTIVQLGKDFKSHSVVDSVRIKDNTFTQTPVRSNMPVPFAPRPSWGVLSDDRVWVALAGDYVLRFFFTGSQFAKTGATSRQADCGHQRGSGSLFQKHYFFHQRRRSGARRAGSYAQRRRVSGVQTLVQLRHLG